MSAVAIGADRIFGDISTVFALLACPFFAKGFHSIRFPVALLMTLLAHGLDFTASVKNVRRCHHTFVVHMLDRPAVTVGTRNAFGDVTSNGIILGKIDMTDQAQ